MLPHLAARVFGTPLLIHRAKLDVILSVLGHRIGAAEAASAPEPLAAALPRKPNLPTAQGIAVIGVHGTLVKRTLGLEAASGLSSYLDLGQQLDAALKDPAVAGILLDVDSPGGEASGSFELARRVREAAAIKPVWAVANDAAFSAAYAIACAGERLVVTETGGVGSIGVIALHVDQSLRDTTEGYRYTAITAGRHKNDFSPHEPLSDGARTELQNEVDRLQGLFVSHVAAMRKLPQAAVRATEAALYFGPNAVGAGLADAVGTLETTLAEFSQFLHSRSRSTPPARASARTGATHPQENRMSLDETQADTIDKEAARAAQAQALAEGRMQYQVQAQAIAELCLIAGQPQRTAEFLAAGATEAQVRRTLLDARAEQPEIASRITADAGANTSDRPELSPVVAAVKKLTAKE